jgi:hypothetical protein
MLNKDMKFGVDTYSWSKLFLLLKTNWKELIEELIDNSNFFITPEIEKELIHFYPSTCFSQN